MKSLINPILLTAALFSVVVASTEKAYVCRDYIYLEDQFPNGTSCTEGNYPTQEDLDMQQIEMEISMFLKKYCCTFEGGEKLDEDDPIFGHLLRSTGMSVTDFEDQYSSSQQALFWLNEDPNMAGYSRIGQRFALASIYFALNGDTHWKECSRKTDTICSSHNKEAWLSLVQECNWAYLSCDRNLFITGVNMTGNVMGAIDKLHTISHDIYLLGDTLEKIDIRNNFISSTIPTSIGGLRLLSYFDVRENKLTGSLPNELFNATGLQVLNLGHNNFHGELSARHLVELKELRLSFTNISGGISTELPNLAIVDVLATELIGEAPKSLCDKAFNNPSELIMRLECPLSCDGYTIKVNDSSNNCGSFGADSCSDIPGWVGSDNDACDSYETYDYAGCPLYGSDYANNETGIIPNDACCYCGGGECSTCYDTMDKQCSNDNTWSAVVDNETISCIWFEDNDDPGCANTYLEFLIMPNVSDPRVSCCYCSQYCQDLPSCGRWTEVPSSTPSVSARPNALNIPSATPSTTPSSQNSSVTPSLVPSSVPIGDCYDYVEWKDITREGCDWYEIYDKSGCPIYGEYDNKEGITASEACCFCGGGKNSIDFDSFNASCKGSDDSWINTVSTGNIAGDSETCNFLDFIFVGNEDALRRYCNKLHNGSTFMADACCICNSLSTTSSTDEDSDDSCTDLQIPKPWPERSCEWFSQNHEYRCAEFGGEILLEGNGKNRIANEVCCVCGGGTRGCYEFIQDWTDSHPDQPYSCSEYDLNGRCAVDGSGLTSFGHNANTECCVCGGGYTVNENVVQESSNKSCIDEYDWTSDQKNCSYFADSYGAPDYEKCLSLGHILSVHDVNASSACCNCWYGYDARTGGGYRGLLLGKMLRIGTMEYTDIGYVHRFTESGDIVDNSTIYKFVKDASASYGFGLILYEMEDLIQSYDLGSKSNDTYAACLSALDLSLLDMCIGPFKNSTFTESAKTTDALYNEEYILVVRELKVAGYKYFLLPFAAFSHKAWIGVITVVLALSCLHRWYVDELSRMRDGGNATVLNKQSFWENAMYFVRNSCGIFFYFFSYFNNGSVETEINDDGSMPVIYVIIEKVIVVALATFVFITLILYGSGTAALFVHFRKGPEFETFHDLLNDKINKTVCFHDSLKDVMEEMFPTDTRNFDYSNETDENRLVSLLDSEGCDGVIISRYSLSYIATQVKTDSLDLLRSCKSLYPLYDDELFTQDVVIPISPTLGSLGDELIDAVNKMLSEDRYIEDHYWFASIGEECEFEGKEEKGGVVTHELFAAPFVFSLTLALVSIILIIYKFSKRKHNEDPVDQEVPLIEKDIQAICTELEASNEFSSGEIQNALNKLPDMTELFRLCLKYEITKEKYENFMSSVSDDEVLKEFELCNGCKDVVHILEVLISPAGNQALSSALANDPLGVHRLAKEYTGFDESSCVTATDSRSSRTNVPLNVSNEMDDLEFRPDINHS